MRDVLAAVRHALGPTSRVARIAGGYVPYPARRPDGGNGFVVNCEYLGALAGEPAASVLEDARADAATILRALSAVALVDTAVVCVRFGLYNGDSLRETVYACNVPAGYLAEAAVAGDFGYWRVALGTYPTEYSTIDRISAALLADKENGTI